MVDQPANARRPRLLVSAFACGPVDEPEASAGWAIVKAASLSHDVWVFTRTRFATAVEGALAADPVLAERVHPIFMDLSPSAMRRATHSWDLYWYYLGWQRLLARKATRLHAEINKALAVPALRDRLSGEALEPMPMTPAEFGQYMQNDIATWTKLAKERDIQLTE